MKIKIPNIKLPFNHEAADLQKYAAKKLKINPERMIDLQIAKRSVDARRKPDIYYIYSLIIEIKGQLKEAALKKAGASPYYNSQYQQARLLKERIRLGNDDHVSEQVRPIIVGSGPAGLYAALVLARAGLRPLVFERGQKAQDRLKTIEDFNHSGVLDLNSNISFGEGGAGTFSDGKLNTGVKDKFSRKDFILHSMVRHGAPKEILYIAKPHLGTDNLVNVVTGLRQEIISLGGQFFFNHLVFDIEELVGGESDDLSTIKVKVKNIVTDDVKSFQSNHLVLATGHSARDTFNILHKRQIHMSPKPFAIGLRIEHPQKWINYSQYGREHYMDSQLPAAEYKLTYQSQTGRGVYSFCMCPGGIVVNGASDQGGCVSNGMSLFARDKTNANSAIIVTVKPEDYMTALAKDDQSPLAGIEFQKIWEKKVYDYCGGYHLITQSYGDFYQDVTGKNLMNNPLLEEEIYQLDSVESSSPGKVMTGPIKDCLPDYVSQSIVEAIEAFGKKIIGFNHPKALLTGVETRTSSPVRIHRDDEFYSSIKGVYPCGEGAGYAGGIMSAAIDGMKVAEKIIEHINLQS